MADNIIQAEEVDESRLSNFIAFTNDVFDSNLRVMSVDRKLLFIGNDVAKALGYKYPKDAVSAHCKHATIRTIEVKSYNQYGSFNTYANVACIPEGDVYRLIMRSNLPRAEEFEEYIVDELIPAANAKFNLLAEINKIEIGKNAGRAAIETKEILKTLIADVSYDFRTIRQVILDLNSRMELNSAIVAAILDELKINSDVRDADGFLMLNPIPGSVAYDFIVNGKKPSKKTPFGSSAESSAKSYLDVIRRATNIEQ